MKNAIIFSISSGIGHSLCLRLLNEGFTVYGTYNTMSEEVEKLEKLKVNLYQCNLLKDKQLDKTLATIKADAKSWNALFILQASMNPIGKISDININEWESSIKLNFINQIKIIQALLEIRSKNDTPTVLTFAGGGTNSATKNYSAYTISKISLIKMMELLYEEYSDTKFTCVGPGWVKTKIHNETLSAKNNAQEAYEQTILRHQEDNFTDMETVIDCLIWVVNSKKEHVSGRNFSVVFDKWGDESLLKELENNDNMYKLRREGNSWNN